MRANRHDKQADVVVSGHAGPTVDGGRHGIWRQRRAADEGRDWLMVELATSDALRGEARAPYSDTLSDTVGDLMQLTTPEANAPGHADTRERRLARGLVATARLDLRARQHGVPLHLWMGGAVRPAARITLPVALRAADSAGRSAELRCERARLHDARALGVTSFAIHDGATNVNLIARSAAAVRDVLGPEASLMLRLSGQLDVAPARELAAQVRPCDLVAIADPCASVADAIDATRDDLPALALSASRYARAALLQCLATAPPVVILVDPLIEGGPIAVRELAAVARVLQTDIALTAEDGGAWLFQLCAELATVFPACQQPIEAPLSWTTATLRGLGVADGALRPNLYS